MCICSGSRVYHATQRIFKSVIVEILCLSEPGITMPP